MPLLYCLCHHRGQYIPVIVTLLQFLEDFLNEAMAPTFKFSHESDFFFFPGLRLLYSAALDHTRSPVRIPRVQFSPPSLSFFIASVLTQAPQWGSRVRQIYSIKDDAVCNLGIPSLIWTEMAENSSTNFVATWWWSKFWFSHVLGLQMGSFRLNCGSISNRDFILHKLDPLLPKYPLLELNQFRNLKDSNLKPAAYE